MNPITLSLEQEFKLQAIANLTKEISLEQAQKHIVDLTRQSMIKDNIIKDLLKNK